MHGWDIYLCGFIQKVTLKIPNYFWKIIRGTYLYFQENTDKPPFKTCKNTFCWNIEILRRRFHPSWLFKSCEFQIFWNNGSFTFVTGGNIRRCSCKPRPPTVLEKSLYWMSVSESFEKFFNTAVLRITCLKLIIAIISAWS